MLRRNGRAGVRRLADCAAWGLDMRKLFNERTLAALLVAVGLVAGLPTFCLWLHWLRDGGSVWNDAWARFYFSMAVYVPAVSAAIIFANKED